MKYQAVRVSDKYPIVHAASVAITEETKRLSQAFCGAYLWKYSLINRQEPVSCARCLQTRQRWEGEN